VAEKLATRIRLVDFHDFGYEALQHAQRHMLGDTLNDGGARWLPVPYATSQGIIDFGRPEPENCGVLVHVEVLSDSPVADLTWMAAKAYSYALYTGCSDLLKRRAVWVEGRRRVLGAGMTETCEAMIGAVRMRVTVTVLDPSDVERAR